MNIIKDLIYITYWFIVGFILMIFHFGKVNSGSSPRYDKACEKENKKFPLGSQRNPLPSDEED